MQVKKNLRAVTNLYRLRFASSMIVALRAHQSSLRDFVRWYMSSQTFQVRGKLAAADRPFAALLVVAQLAQIVIGVLFLVDWARYGTAGSWAFGSALLLAYPLTAVVLIVLGVGCGRAVYYLAHPKALGKAVVARVLEHQVNTLRKKHHVKVVAVAGSVGKTSTKFAIAQLLGQSLRVRYQEGNYNDRLTVPLVFFGQTEPSLYNVFAWLRMFGENAASIHHPYPYDVVVVEIGTDGPGQMKHFAYLKPDITVVTAVTPEHMAFFKTLDAVAAEELSVFDYSKKVLVNGDNVPGKYLIGRQFTEYSVRTNAAHNYYAKPHNHHLGGQDLQMETPSGSLQGSVKFVGAQGAICSLAAVAVADMLGLSRKDIIAALPALEPYAGRMRVLEGVKGATIIDDTYNASPVAVKAALDVLYAAKTKQRIALLGSMNELGEYSREAHTEVGAYCNPRKLDLVLTLGRDAERWIAPAARANGCVVHSFRSHRACADYIKKHLKKDAVILAKGSQNGVFAEEVVKLLLAHPADTSKLVRQSHAWLKIKSKQFND